MNKNKIIVIVVLLILLGVALGYSGWYEENSLVNENDDERVYSTYSGNGKIIEVKSNQLVVDTAVETTDPADPAKTVYKKRTINTNFDDLIIVRRVLSGNSISFKPLNFSDLLPGMEVTFQTISNPKDHDILFVNKIEVLR